MYSAKQQADWSAVKFTEEDAKGRAPAWAKAPGMSLEKQREKWRNDNEPAGYEYTWAGTATLPKTKNLSALLCLELVEAANVNAAVARVISALSDELLVILEHQIHELKQTYVRGRTSSGKAFRVDAKTELAAQYEAVLKSWNAQRAVPPDAATLRVVAFIRDVASSVARPENKMYIRSDDYVGEAITSGALQQNDLPTLSKLTAAALADIQAPPCTKYQSLRIALQRIERCLTTHLEEHSKPSLVGQSASSSTKS